MHSSFLVPNGLRLGSKGTLRWTVESKEFIPEVTNDVDRQTVGNSMKGPLREFSTSARQTTWQGFWKKEIRIPAAAARASQFSGVGGAQKSTSLQPGSDSSA